MSIGQSETRWTSTPLVSDRVLSGSISFQIAKGARLQINDGRNKVWLFHLAQRNQPNLTGPGVNGSGSLCYMLSKLVRSKRLRCICGRRPGRQSHCFGR
jgi:hypothetical protein